MKKNQEQLIGRGLDGDLDEMERSRLDLLLAEHEDARQSHRHWQAVGDLLREETAHVATPDPAVAWQDIRRAIRLADSDAPSTSPVGRLRWSLAMASLLVVGLLSWSVWQLTYRASVDEASISAARVEWVVAEVPGATTMIYTDEETDLTVIWLDVAQNADPRDT